MTQPNLILATDLDGTFLGGSQAQRAAFYEHLNDRDDVMLIFVTGRDVDFCEQLINTPGMPRPDYIIGDVGTSVFDGATLQPITDLEHDIARAWNDSGDRIRTLLAGEPGIRLQDTPFRHRLSYDYDPNAFSPFTMAKIEAAGFDCLLSADRFLDVLPRGISKGPTLRRLVEQLDLPEDRVLVAGDTLNDLSLFRTGYKGVAVGNSEARLKAAILRLANVYRSPAPGVAGIADAIRHFRFKGTTHRAQVTLGDRLSPAT